VLELGLKEGSHFAERNPRQQASDTGRFSAAVFADMGNGAGLLANPVAERTFPGLIFTTLADQNLVQR
jgi:hypothetical protein